jgi:fatty acid desaturase
MKTHPFDVLSFVAGAVFVGLGVAFLAAGADVAGQAHWLWPMLLVLLGGAGLASALRRDDR